MSREERTARFAAAVAVSAALLLVASSWGMLSAAPLSVYVTLPPLAEALESVGGGEVSVGVLLPAGVSPETYQPDARTVASLGRAELLLTIGAPFEETLLPRLKETFPALTVVDGTREMAFRTFPDGGRDPHVWLSLDNLSRFAKNACDALCTARPEHADAFRENLAKYRASLAALNDRNRELLSPLSGKAVLVYHPAFGYFLGEYGIKQLSIEEEGKEPSPRELLQTIREARSLRVPAIFVQPQFSPRTARVLADELKCRVVPLDPLPENASRGLREMAEAIAREYQILP